MRHPPSCFNTNMVKPRKWGIEQERLLDFGSGNGLAHFENGNKQAPSQHLGMGMKKCILNFWGQELETNIPGSGWISGDHAHLGMGRGGGGNFVDDNDCGNYVDDK